MSLESGIQRFLDDIAPRSWPAERIITTLDRWKVLTGRETT